MTGRPAKYKLLVEQKDIYKAISIEGEETSGTGFADECGHEERVCIVSWCLL